MSFMDYVIIALCVFGTVVVMAGIYWIGKEKGKEEIRREVLASVFELISEIDNDG